MFTTIKRRKLNDKSSFLKKFPSIFNIIMLNYFNLLIKKEMENFDQIVDASDRDIDDDNDFNLVVERYSDEHITITNNEIIINKYYFPFSKKKVIKLNKIKRVEKIKLELMNGKYKFSGLSFNLWWFHMDRKRPTKDYCIIIHDGSVIKPAITPNNIDQVYDILHGLIKK